MDNNRYKSPQQRSREAARGGIMGEDAPPQEPVTPPEPNANPPESVSGFLPKAFFGEQMPKPGESITVVVKAVDPETGEVEVTKSESMPESGNLMDKLDQAMPDDQMKE